MWILISFYMNWTIQEVHVNSNIGSWYRSSYPIPWRYIVLSLHVDLIILKFHVNLKISCKCDWKNQPNISHELFPVNMALLANMDLNYWQSINLTHVIRVFGSLRPHWKLLNSCYSVHIWCDHYFFLKTVWITLFYTFCNLAYYFMPVQQYHTSYMMYVGLLSLLIKGT